MTQTFVCFLRSGKLRFFTTVKTEAGYELTSGTATTLNRSPVAVANAILLAPRKHRRGVEDGPAVQKAMEIWRRNAAKEGYSDPEEVSL